jgi:rhodanese-related sulfurtransferase
MKNFFLDIAGGLAICVAAALVGLAHNAVRERSLPVIQNIKSTASTNQSNAQASGVHNEEIDPLAGSSDPGATLRQEILQEGTITADQLREMLEDGTIVIIDARSPEEFDEGRVAGAINVPFDQIAEHYQQLMAEIPMDAFIVCYCQGPDCDFSHELATELKIMGFVNVVLFSGGWEHWQAAGYPIEASE